MRFDGIRPNPKPKYTRSEQLFAVPMVAAPSSAIVQHKICFWGSRWQLVDLAAGVQETAYLEQAQIIQTITTPPKAGR